ncbi:hypothetical protein HHL17_17135 [Chitinophaga sp. G-6-1-13]|uniref:Uncharacterized protein n=1 Tax=Chitinophaga fulva TaxID=2728842 RepID=A0A848GQ74_9BACT|nr:hypothetical protein [Chitinophaga fulva]NML38933.1 hypothetical protein [Chitinophaga fulva]
MIYEIKLSGAKEDDGKIELHRLAHLAQSITDIASGALRIRLTGISFASGRRNERISNAIKIHLADLRTGSTVLQLECETFKDTLSGQQGDVFNPGILEVLPDQTPMTLVMESFRQAIDYKEGINYLDKGLLKKLKSFEKIFLEEDESVTISNQGSIQELKLKRSDIKKIQKLEESIPEPQEIIINGIVDELKYSKSRISIATADGSVNGILSDMLEPQEISKYWGKNLTISGKAHYQPNGDLSFIYIEKIFEPSEADKYFSRTSKKETVEQQILRQQRQLKNSNHLNEIVGQWPGEEDIDEILKALD